MNRRCSQLGTWMLVALVLPTVAYAGTTSAAVVRGVVRDAQGAPQMGALVQLLAPDATAIASAVTDMKGRYRILGVVPGRYQMRATATLFLPALRRNLRLVSGAQATVNLTLTALINTGQWLPARRRSSTEADDDWKWTLRSAENRPVLRVLQDGSAVIEPADGEGAGGPLLADRRVVTTAGSGAFGGGGLHTVMLADHGSRDGSAEIMRADVGAGAAPSLDLSAGYERGLGYAGTVRMAVLYQDHRQLVTGSGSGLSSVTMVNAEKMQMGDLLEVEAGSLMRAVETSGTGAVRGTQALPFVRVSAEPVRGLMVSYRMTMARELQSFADMDALGWQMPTATGRDGQMRMESGRHQELSVTERMGQGLVQAAMYEDHLGAPAIAGIGLPGEQMARSGDVLVDPVTATFRILGPAYEAHGVSIAVSEPITPSLWVSGEYDSGNALAGAMPGEMHTQWSQAGMAAVQGKWSGGTQLRVSYRWQPSNTLTAVDSYRADATRAYLGIFVRQPLRCRHVLPDGLEAVVDVSNLLAQGYRPIGVSADGGTLFLAQTARMVQGGLAFTF